MNPDDRAGGTERGDAFERLGEPEVHALERPDEPGRSALELEIGLALREIESPRAPATLLPRVLAAARAAALRPWYTRPWFAWPREWQTASVLALVEVLVAGWMWIPALGVSLPPVGGALTRFLGPVVAPLAAAQADLAAVFRAVEISVRAVGPALGFFGWICMLMLAACAALGAGIGRLALGRRYP